MARTGERLDRKALKEDALLNVVEHAGDYVRTNTNLMLGVGAGLVVLALLVMLWRQDVNHKATQSSESLSQVVLAFSNNQFDQTIELSNALQTSAPGSQAAVLSKYLAGASHLRLGHYPEAEQALRSYLDSVAKDPFYESAARNALAASLEGQSKFAEAATIYQELADKQPEPLASEARISAARALGRAGSVDQAKAMLEKLAADVGNGATAREAKLELSVLQSARP